MTPSELIEALGSDMTKGERERALEAIREMGDARAVDAVEALCTALRSDRLDYAALVALVKIGAPAVEALCGALGGQNSGARKNAAEALGKIGNTRAVEPLCKALGDVEGDVRKNAAAALAKFCDARAVEPLCKVLGDAESDVRKSSAAALAKFCDARAMEPLCKALGDTESAVRGSAAQALGLLLHAHQRPPRGFRRFVHFRTGSIGDTRAVEALFRTLGDVDRHVRLSSALALGKFGDARAAEELCIYLEEHSIESDSAVRQAATEALVRIGAPAVKPLKRILHFRGVQTHGRNVQVLCEALIDYWKHNDYYSDPWHD